MNSLASSSAGAQRRCLPSRRRDEEQAVALWKSVEESGHDEVSGAETGRRHRKTPPTPTRTGSIMSQFV
jgi:hypothetical protein